MIIVGWIKKICSNNIFLLLTNLLLLLCFFSQFKTLNIGYFFNGDSLYLPSVYRDLFVDGSGLQGWHFNPAPNFFPDMFFYFILMFVCGNNFIISSFLFGVIQYFLFLYLLTRLFKLIAPNKSTKFYALIYFIPTLFMLGVFYLNHSYMMGYFLVSNSYHTGAFIMALLGFLLTLHLYYGKSLANAIILFFLVFLAVVSDKLFLAGFVAPVLFSSVFLIKKYTRITLMVMSVTLISSGLALWVFNNMQNSGYIFFGEVHVNDVTIEKITTSFQLFISYIKDFMINIGYHTIAIYMFIISVFCLVYLLFRNWKSESPALKYALIFLISQSVSIIFAPIATGNFQGVDTFRYNIYPVYIAGLNLAVFSAIYFRTSNFLRQTYNYVMFCLIACTFVAALLKYQPGGLNHFFTYYPETSRKLDNIAEKEGLLRGVGNYWWAKYVTMFSKKGVKIHAAFEDLAPYTHVTNENWFFDPKHKFNFVLLNDFSDTVLYKTKLLKTERLYDENELILVKTNVFSYERPNYSPKNN